MNGNRKHSHGSVERVLNLAQMAKGSSMPESLRHQFQRQLDKEQFEIQKLLELDPEVEHTPKHHLELWAEDLNKRINKWFKDKDEEDEDEE
jgi:hypothetical protein